MENNKLFLYDNNTGLRKSYAELIEDLHALNEIPVFLYEKNVYQFFLYIIASLLADVPVTVLDYDFSREEIEHLGIEEEQLQECRRVKLSGVEETEDIFRQNDKVKNWQVSLFTSGTTGTPKRITHSYLNITRSVRVDEFRKNDLWGLAYNPTHIAGLQVFFQAFLNGNSIVNIFLQDADTIRELIEQEGITHISATPTYFRLLLPASKSYPGVRRITMGGEKFDSQLAEKLQPIFPNAKILNVYASTEAGTVLASNGDYFTVKEKDKDKIKIVGNELWVHRRLLGEADLFTSGKDWYPTGDIVEIISEKPLSFRFVSRKNEMINVGGYKVNPHEVEEAINSHPLVKNCRVYGKKSSLVGNLLLCDVEAVDDSLNEVEITKYLQNKLQPFKIPRIINLVKKIETTRTGKIKR